LKLKFYTGFEYEVLKILQFLKEIEMKPQR
jgi:hypothetical protein